MKATFEKVLLRKVKLYTWVVFVLTTGFVFLNCKTNVTAISSPAKEIKVLMVGGGSSHDFNKWYKQADGETLRKNNLAQVTYLSNPDSILLFLPQTDVLFLSNNQPINDPKVRQAIFDFAQAGKGLVLAHPALWYNWKDWPEYNLQLVSGGSRGHDKYGSFEVTVTKPKHPVMKGVEPKFTLKDERYYYNPDPAGPGIEVLANSSVAGSDKIYPSIFIIKHPKARIVGVALGHDAESHNIANYQNIIRNAVQWAAKK
ncbi:ThuA domain-containing protein [Adhaeribacter swui]|uniref:ThuA domain-containing protein n=2 Tax=Adhaeribacter swui TaxID=2086471 RepID=A0A7G7GF08_9BACT|nr:ThuA domain-containing protein [Adhaeribacter swui]